MKKTINSRMSTLFLIAVLALTGCEAGLTSNDGSGNGNGDGEDFSFSDLYSNMRAMKEEIQDLKEKVSPPGTINPFAGGNVPAGWLLCDGQAYGRTEYTELFQAIGTAWGTPDGYRFNVPDLRGVFLRGVDGGTGKDPDAALRGEANPGGNTGNTVGSLQGDAYQYHTHYIESWAGYNSNGYANPRNAGYGDAGPYGDSIPTKSSTGSHSTETRPANAYVNYIIKY
ncbi:MAG: hypothetical protein GY754_26725 [bacterium]|nr:hypothetical protein [bacterium]